MRTSRIVGLIAVAGLAGSAPARPIFPEVEPNDSKAAANIFTLAVGDGVTGNSIAATGAGLDYFRLRTGAAPLGIYRHRLVMTVASGTVFPTATIRGLNQTAPTPGPWPGPVGTAGTEATFQIASTPAGTSTRVNQWYGFGKQEELYYRLAGTATSTADYTAVLETVPVIPTAIGGTFSEGRIYIATVLQGHATDTDLWVYDSNLNAIPGYGNDDESIIGGTIAGGLSLQSFVMRNYTAGTYYIALSNFQLANNMGSPCDDDFGSGALMDFANIAANSSAAVNLDMTFTISDGVNTVQVANTKLGAFDINWFSFTVVPAPGTLALLGLGGLLIGRRRR